MSHFIKDSEGNYHEYSDEQYAELQRKEDRDLGKLLGFIIILIGFFIAAVGRIAGSGVYPWWIGISVTIIGALVYGAHSSKTGLVIVIILTILAYYWGAYRFCNKIHSFFYDDEEKEKTEAVETPVYNQMDEPIAVFANYYTS